MKNFIFLLPFSLIFSISFNSCGTNNEEVFNTTDYIYVIINIGKQTDIPNRDSKLFKINGKSETDLSENFNYVNSILIKQGHPFNLALGPSDEIFTFKVKAKNIKDVLSNYKITITTDETQMLLKKFEDTGLGTTNSWCYTNGVKDITTETDFSNVKLVFIKYTYSSLDNGSFKRSGQLHDKLTGESDDFKNSLSCSKGLRDEPIGVWYAEY